MGQGIGEVLTFAIAVAISPIPIIAVILMLFSARARVNGPAFLVGWVVALAVVSTVVYVLAHDGDVATSSTAADSVSWGKIALGVVLLLLARRNWRNRPAPGEQPALPKWMAQVDTLTPIKAAGLGVILAAVNPKNLILTMGSAAGLAQLGLTTSDAIVATVVFVVIASLTIAGPGPVRGLRRGAGPGVARLGQDLAGRAQRGRHGGALPRVRRRPHRQGATAADLKPCSGLLDTGAAEDTYLSSHLDK